MTIITIEILILLHEHHMRRWYKSQQRSAKAQTSLPIGQAFCYQINVSSESNMDICIIPESIFFETYICLHAVVF